MTQPQQHISFVLGVEEARAAGSDAINIIMNLIRGIRPFARAPLFGLQIGALGREYPDGRVFLGVNVELPGLPLHHSISAEQFLIANLALNSVQIFDEIAVSANGIYFNTPSGHCCQLLQEYPYVHEIRILITDPNGANGIFRRLGDLFVNRSTLPYNNINHPRNNGLIFFDIADICMWEGPCLHMRCNALKAANKSYAVYSGCPSGVVLKDRQQRLYKGWYIESVALNPSLGPVQAALVDFVANGGGQFEEIRHAVLVEKFGAAVSQEDTARMILSKIAPQCDFKVVHCIGIEQN